MMWKHWLISHAISCQQNSVVQQKSRQAVFSSDGTLRAIFLLVFVGEKGGSGGKAISVTMEKSTKGFYYHVQVSPVKKTFKVPTLEDECSRKFRKWTAGGSSTPEIRFNGSEMFHNYRRFQSTWFLNSFVKSAKKSRKPFKSLNPNTILKKVKWKCNLFF